MSSSSPSLFEPPELDRRVGMLVYVTRSRPVDGKVRGSPEEFEVEEVTDLKIVDKRLDKGYAVFLMEKRRMDTFSAVRRAARLLGVSVGDVGYAGLKDTVAVTRQYVTVPVWKLSKLDKEAGDNRLSLRFIGYSNRRLKPGFLLGNRFKIRVSLRDRGELKGLLDALEEVSRLSGIPGFYGYQRFGVRRPNTHVVGRLLVKRMWDEAVREIAGNPYPWEPSLSYKARRLFEEGRLEEALEAYPRTLFYERLIVKRLLEGWRPFKALRSLPRRLLRLYLSGYQSYLFNLALSRRLLETDLDPTRILDGDLVKGVRDSYMVRKGLSIIYMIAPGARFRRFEGRACDMVWEVLREEGVEPEEFKVKELGVRCNAAFREVFMPFKGLTLEATPQLKPLLSFTLPSGGYATVLLRELLKQDPLKAGF